MRSGSPSTSTSTPIIWTDNAALVLQVDRAAADVRVRHEREAEVRRRTDADAVIKAAIGFKVEITPMRDHARPALEFLRIRRTTWLKR
jgi:hypothetical protein